jgi:hypothetical protein
MRATGLRICEGVDRLISTTDNPTLNISLSVSRLAEREQEENEKAFHRGVHV